MHATEQATFCRLFLFYRAKSHTGIKTALNFVMIAHHTMVKYLKTNTISQKFPCILTVVAGLKNRNRMTIAKRFYKGQKNKTEANEVKDMKISDNGINMLKKFEGSVTKGDKHVIYDDKTGKPVDVNKPLPGGATIGYGHLIKPNEDFRNGISEAKATELLRADIATAERAVRDNITVPLSQNQFDALTSLAYNIGAKNFANSTVIRYINNPNFHSSVYQNLESVWKAWNKSGGHVMAGLSNRRNQEWNIFNN